MPGGLLSARHDSGLPARPARCAGIGADGSLVRLLRLARASLAHAGALEISHECLRWAWPLAARAAHDLHDIAASCELLALLDAYQPGYLAPMLRAE